MGAIKVRNTNRPAMDARVGFWTVGLGQWMFVWAGEGFEKWGVRQGWEEWLMQRRTFQCWVMLWWLRMWNRPKCLRNVWGW